jgi:peptide/nickel transport system permease protein
MNQYLLRRLLQLIPTLFGMSALVFLMLRLLPGDVVDAMVGGDMTVSDADKQELRRQLGLSDPLPVQYVRWIVGMLHGDFGTSIRSGAPTLQTLLRSLPITVELMVLAVVLSTTIAIPLGVVSAVRRDHALDYFSRLAGLIGLSLPSFWLATLALLFTSLTFHWVPPVEYISPLTNPAANLGQMIIPAAAIALQLMAIEMRMTRTMMLEVLRQDYIRTARAKGLTEGVLIYRHALRNALIPVVSVIGFQVGALMGGSAIVETIFGLNGVGWTLVQAIFNRDYPLIQTATLFLATVFVLVNVVVDLMYSVLDPRIATA